MAVAQVEFSKELQNFVQEWKDKPGNLIMILHRVQHEFTYIPRAAAERLSKELKMPLAKIFGVMTFYNYFKVDPPGKYTIAVCLGTACYLKGAPDILEEIKSLLNIEEGQTTKDGLFHLDPVRCLGCCSLAPVISVNGKIYGRVKKSDVVDILAQYKSGGTTV